MYDFLKSVIDQDRSPVVLCDTAHIVIYMNPAAVKRYASRGGADLIGKSLMNCHNSQSNAMIEKVLEWFAASREHNMVYISRNDMENKDVYMVALRDAEGNLIGYYEKHEYRNPETAERYDFGAGDVL